MSQPIIKEPTEWLFHFPKKAENPAAKVAKRPARTRKTEADEPAATESVSDSEHGRTDATSTPVVIEEKTRRAKKKRVVRDSVTMLESDYVKIAELKKRCIAAGVQVTKSELLRAGLQLLALSPQTRLIAAVAALEPVKVGRPEKS